MASYYIMSKFSDREDDTHKMMIENSQLNNGGDFIGLLPSGVYNILVCPSTWMTEIQILIFQPNNDVKTQTHYPDKSFYFTHT